MSRDHSRIAVPWRGGLRHLYLPLLAGLALAGCLIPAVFAKEEEKEKSAESAAMESSAEREALLLDGVRQLTFEGKRAGEGYFSADGTKMIFQSEREPENPFFQIYLMDLETGDTERVSPGQGKTTCAWIHPDGKRVLFASTQDDPDALKEQEEELADRAAGKERRYSWDYDTFYDIYEYDLEKKTYRKLTDAKGYDAEGSYSPDGSKVAFASNRHAYTGEEELSKEDEKWFSMNPSFMMDLYIMDSDGSNVRRLTKTPGYDGGPFFSADGSKICWRRFSREGDTAEVFSMNVDGTEEKQLTKIGAMSWAPYFHPSGEYLIFTTNKHGFANFELYLVDAKGEKEPVRVTHTDGFDGLPAFSPDGKHLAWTSNRTSDKKSQIFIGDWNHEAARALLGLSGESSTSDVAPGLSETDAAVSADDLRAHIAYLASEKLQGRLTGTPGEKLATEYVAEYFGSLGLEPAGDEGTFFQEFEFTAGVDLGKENRLTLKTGEDETEFEADKAWRPLSFSEIGEVDPTGVVFAGYGIEIPEEATDAKGEKVEMYSSYYHLDVADKWVMVFRFFPEDVDRERRRQFGPFSALRYKAMEARKRGAKGIIFVTGPNSRANDELVDLTFDASMASSGLPAISVSRATAQKILDAAGKDLQTLQTGLDSGEMAAGFSVGDITLSAKVDIQQEKRTGHNVLARLKAADPEAQNRPDLAIGAHVDHLGPDAGPGSLARDDEKDQIHYGADDNASGVAAMMEVAQYLATQVEAGKLTLKRDVLFAAWSGEELGLIGSSYFVRQEAKNLKGDENAPLGGAYAAYLNMDMVGRLSEKLILQGLGSSSVWPGVVERRNAPVGLSIVTQKDTYLPTDATSFYLRQVPILSAFTGAHEDYHTPRDTADKINYEGAEDIARFMALVARGLASDPEAPDYVKVDPPKQRGSSGSLRAYLGTVPDYSQGDVEGVKLSGVADGGPAAKAGVRGGDVIVGLGGTEILNIYDYTNIISTLKVGEETEIKVKRGDEVLTLKITPGSRE